MRKPKTHLTKDDILSRFAVDVEAGTLQWLSPSKAAQCKKSGQAGVLVATGYRVVQIAYSNYFVHRLIWLCAHGKWPDGEIDHINGDKSDNRLANLRDVSRRVNKQNIRKANTNNTTGLLGVSAWKGRWAARINVNGRDKTIGYFDTPEAAHAAYVEHKRRLHVGNTL